MKCEVVDHTMVMVCRSSRLLYNRLSDQRMRQKPTCAWAKMELISNAAAKMMNAAVKCELTSAEVWTLAKKRSNYLEHPCQCSQTNPQVMASIQLSSIDLTARRDDGQFWDLGTKEDRNKIGANATGTSDRTLEWKRAVHLFPHVTLSLWNEDPN